MEAMAGDTHFVCLGGKTQVIDLNKSACVCVYVCVCVCVCVYAMHSSGVRVLIVAYVY